MIARVALISALVLYFSATEACAARPEKLSVSPAAGMADAGIAMARTGTLKAVWTQFGPGGVLEARTVVAGADCPEIVLDLRQSPMQKRATEDRHFLTVCTAVIPAGTKQAALAFFPPQIEPRQKIETEAPLEVVPLALATPDPTRILVLGDTGCRIKGTTLQDCSKPEMWPFPVLAVMAARLKPDLVIHVGDYLYRESACPATFKGCEGTPFGDNWPSWDADFFTPAASLLAVAPWVIVRGNHEDCRRAGPGFLRLLGPLAYDPAAACPEHLAPYSVLFQGLNLVVGDDVDVAEQTLVDKALPVYAREFADLAKAPPPTWLLMHRPIWGLVTGPLGLPVGGNLTLMAAAGEHGIPSPVSLLLSGHIHTFEAINYEPANHVPPQVVAGFGGDLLDVTPANLRGAIFQGSYGVHVHDGISVGGFGFLLLTKTAASQAGERWTVDVYNSLGRIQRQCLFQNGRVDCPPPAKQRH